MSTNALLQRMLQNSQRTPASGADSESGQEGEQSVPPLAAPFRSRPGETPYPPTEALCLDGERGRLLWT